MFAYKHLSTNVHSLRFYQFHSSFSSEKNKIKWIYGIHKHDVIQWNWKESANTTAQWSIKQIFGGFVEQFSSYSLFYLFFRIRREKRNELFYLFMPAHYSKIKVFLCFLCRHTHRMDLMAHSINILQCKYKYKNFSK